MDNSLLATWFGVLLTAYDHYQNNIRGKRDSEKLDEILRIIQKHDVLLESVLIERKGKEPMFLDFHQENKVIIAPVKNLGELKEATQNNLPCILDDKKDNITVCTLSDTVINNTSEENIEFILYYSKRASSFSSQKCISINIPKDTEEYLQMNVINTEIGINKRLYFEFRYPLMRKSKFFKSRILKERKYKKPVRITCWGSQKKIFLEVNMDGIIICKESWLDI